MEEKNKENEKNIRYWMRDHEKVKILQTQVATLLEMAGQGKSTNGEKINNKDDNNISNSSSNVDITSPSSPPVHLTTASIPASTSINNSPEVKTEPITIDGNKKSETEYYSFL